MFYDKPFLKFERLLEGLPSLRRNRGNPSLSAAEMGVGQKKESKKFRPTMRKLGG